MMTFFIAFISSFCFVGMKSFQQLNVVHKQYLLVMPTSMLMALCEVYVIATVAKSGFGWLAFFVGLGAGLGCMTSMYFHGKLTKND